MFLICFQTVCFSQNPPVNVRALEMSIYDDWEKEEKRDFEDNILYKASIKNYIYINCQNDIIAIHPTKTTTFNFLHIATNLKSEISFCCSRKYGTFWINDEIF